MSEAADESRQEAVDNPTFGSTLQRIVEKLTNQMLLFLLGYGLLLIGITQVDTQLPEPVSLGLLLIPIVGASAYMYEKKRKLQHELRLVNVGVGFAGDRAYVAGVRGEGVDGDVDVGVGVATGGAQVLGVDAAPSAHLGDAQAAYLIQIYENLDDAARGQLIQRALVLKAGKEDV